MGSANKMGSAHPLDSNWQITSYLLFWVCNRIFWGAPSGAFVAPDQHHNRRRRPPPQWCLIRDYRIMASLVSPKSGFRWRYIYFANANINCFTSHADLMLRQLASDDLGASN